MINQLALNSLGRVTEILESAYRLRANRIHKFKSKVDIFVEVGPFVVKTANTVEELKEAFRLRYQVFYREMIGVSRKKGLDIDEYDALCDHLVIVEKRTGKIVGTYRLNCSLYSDHFYSAREFDLSRILAAPGVKLELGRACIHKDYRKGIVISLLWRGIADYMAATNSQILFGCASVKVDQPREAALLYRHFFETNRFTPEYSAPPTPAYTMPKLDFWIASRQDDLTDVERVEAESLIPPLCRAYLKIGAFLGGKPAWDEEFRCIDFLTVLHREDLNRSLWKKFKLASGES